MVRIKCLFFQNGVLFCGNREVPFFLALSATKQEKAPNIKNYLIKSVHKDKLFALRTRQNPSIRLRIMRTI